jgi:phage terminase large subunit-like protein
MAKSRAPFESSPYQQFTIYNIFAWINRNEIAKNQFCMKPWRRKNGKTTHYWTWFIMPGFDGEEGPEIYVGAT